MVSIYDLKPTFQARLRPLADGLAKRGITANQVTVAAFLLSLAAGALLLISPGATVPLLLVPVVLFIRMALNAIDGMLAREHGQKSDLGALLNELGDLLSDAALYLPFAAIPGVSAILVVTAVVLAGASELAGTAALLIGAARRYDGPMGKSDRALAFGAIAFLLGLGARAGLWLDLLFLVIVVLLLLTIANRIRGALAEAHP
jgi:CDP-diacylglycerol---glycerol-3-phosphate 3-phosphatidyltransferase